MNLETGGCSILKVLIKNKFGTTEAIRKTVCQTDELQKTKLQIPTIHHNALRSTTLGCHGKHQCIFVTMQENDFCFVLVPQFCHQCSTWVTHLHDSKQKFDSHMPQELEPLTDPRHSD